MTDIVINSKSGGFFLSDKAIRRYAELSGITIYAYTSHHISRTRQAFFVLVPEDEVVVGEYYHYYTSNPPSDETHFDVRGIRRDDPILIWVVRELGEEADGPFARLKIVSIPDGINWYIEEHQGNEIIHEAHESWR